MEKGITRTVFILLVCVMLIAGIAYLSCVPAIQTIPDNSTALAAEYASVDDYSARAAVSSLELFCIGMILLLLIYIIFTIKFTQKESYRALNSFGMVCFCALLRFISNLITYHNDGINTEAALRLSKNWTMVLFFSAFLLVLSLAYYVYVYLSDKDKVDRTILYVSGWSTVLAFVSLEINYDKGIFYYFGPSNEYIRGEYYIYYYVFLFAVFLCALCWIIKYSRLLAKKELVALLAVVLMPIAGSIVQLFLPKYNPSDAFITVGIVISFLSLQFYITNSELKGRILNESELVGISEMFMGVYHFNPKTQSFENRNLSGIYSNIVVDSWITNEFYIDHYVHEDDRKLLKQVICLENLIEMNESKKRLVKEYEFRELSNGEYAWRRITFVHREPEKNRIAQLFMVVQDITEEKKLVENSAAQSRRFMGTCAGVYSSIFEWHIETNLALRLSVTSSGIEELEYDSDWEHTIRAGFERMVYVEDKKIAERILPENVKGLNIGQSMSESCRINFTGTFRWHTITVKMLSDDSGGKIALYMMQDIDDVVREHNKLKDRSEHDEMTDLFNRAKLEDMKQTEYKKLTSCGILYFDINNLKTTNDTLGHNFGDQMIMTAAESIRSITNRRILGYRIGGDEMIAVVADATSDEMDSLLSLWKIRLDELNTNSEIKCEIAVGRVWADGEFDFDNLLADADASMYENKLKLKGLK